MADVATPATSVALCANQSFSAFQQCLVAASAVHPRELSMVEDQLARFSTWASSIGVFAPGRASMDHRLRYTLDVQGVVMDLLESLTYRIEACTSTLKSISGGPEIPQTQQLVESFGNIANEISHLNKISNTIRKASKETQHLRVSNFQIQDNEGNEIEPLLLSHFKHYINDLFPTCSETLKDRLSNTMLLRRKRILYRRHRQGNASIRLQETMVQAAVALPSAQTQDTPTASKHKHYGGATPSQVMTATTLASKKFKMVSSTPSVISASKTVALVNHQALTFPPAPGYILKQRFEELREKSMQEFHTSIEGGQTRTVAESKLNTDLQRALQNIGEITCPYCLYAIPAQEAFDERKWQQHVKNDLDPYICLFEDCNSENVLHSHSQEWLNHLRDHAKIWHCFSHPKLDPFTSRDDYIEHIRDVHGSTLNDSQLRALANRNSRKRVDLFPSCPLCGATTTDVTGRMEDHITGHLRSLALKSLPAFEEEVPDDFKSTENSEQISDIPSRSTIRHGSFSGDSIEDEDAMDLGSPVTHSGHGESTMGTLQNLAGLETADGSAGEPKADEAPIESEETDTTMIPGKTEERFEEQPDYKRDYIMDMESAINNSIPGSRLFQRLPPMACVPCRMRRVKCDETYPICKRCTAANFTCKYSALHSDSDEAPIASEDEVTTMIPEEPNKQIGEQSEKLRAWLTQTCLACRDRGLKCSGERPCARCTMLDLACQYQALHSDEIADSDAATIQFTDCVGRKFSLPFNRYTTWPKMQEFIEQLFTYRDPHGQQVYDGFYDLLGPDGAIIPPTAWAGVIQPGWLITMRLWPSGGRPFDYSAESSGVAPEQFQHLPRHNETMPSKISEEGRDKPSSPVPLESFNMDEDGDVAMPYDQNDYHQFSSPVDTETQHASLMERLGREMHASEASTQAMKELKRGASLADHQSDPYPTTTRVLRKQISLEALRQRNIDFEVTLDDAIVIKRLVPEWELEQLRLNSKILRLERQIQKLAPKSSERSLQHQKPQQPMQMDISQVNPGDVLNSQTNQFEQMDSKVGSGILQKGKQAASMTNAGAQEHLMPGPGSSPQHPYSLFLSDSVEIDPATLQLMVPQLPPGIKNWGDVRLWLSQNEPSADTETQLLLIQYQQLEAVSVPRQKAEVDGIEQPEQKARSRVHSRDDSQERKRPRIEESDRSDLEPASDSSESTSPIREAGSSFQNLEQEFAGLPREEQIRARGRQMVKGRNSASHRSTISSSPSAQLSPTQPSEPLEVLDRLHNKFLVEWLPLCEEFLAAPPTDPKKREEKHRHLSESIMAQIIIKLDAVDTEGNEEIRIKRRAIVIEVEDTLRQLDRAKAYAKGSEPASNSRESSSPVPSTSASVESPSNPVLSSPALETEEPISSSKTAAVFTCSEPGCTMSFDQEHKLKHHMRYHSKDHHCTYPGCSKSFGTKTHLQRHITDRHEIKTKFCCFVPGCEFSREGGKAFTRRDNWKRHMMMVHNLAQHQLPDPDEVDPSLDI